MERIRDRGTSVGLCKVNTSAAGCLTSVFDAKATSQLKACYDQVDYNKDGKLEPLEIEIAILKIYNIINKRLPGWQNPPTRPQIQAALKAFDVDGNGFLDRWVRPCAGNPAMLHSAVWKSTDNSVIPSTSLAIRR